MRCDLKDEYGRLLEEGREEWVRGEKNMVKGPVGGGAKASSGV